MDSTNTSFRSKRRGIIQLISPSGKSTQNFSLYDYSSFPDYISPSTEGIVSENYQYGIALLFQSNSPIIECKLSVNGSDEISLKAQQTVKNSSKEPFYKTSFCIDKYKDRLFTLIYGFARIQVSVTFQSSADSPFIFTTQDIPCQSQTPEQHQFITQMLEELLDIGNRTVLNWMFTQGTSNSEQYSILEGSLNKNAPKSMLSLIQLIEKIASTYEENITAFRAHRYCRIVKHPIRLSPHQVHKLGCKEQLWLLKNEDILEKTQSKTGIQYQNNFYMPRYIKTNQNAKSFNTYENRLILGFIQAVLRKTNTLRNSLEGAITSLQTIENDLSGKIQPGFFLPSLTVITQYKDRDISFINRIKPLLKRIQAINRIYSQALPNVKPVFTAPLQYSKVFQEVEAYSVFFKLMQRWIFFGDSTLENENLSLHLFRTDKLYEYYVLYKLLLWLNLHDFHEDMRYKQPIIKAHYSLKNPYFKNEDQVATVYHLCSKNTHVSLYYQPVIYGDETEEYGIALHRLSASQKSIQNHEPSYWTPDYLLTVCDALGTKHNFIFDAKFSRGDSLCRRFPQGRLGESILKYKSDIAALNPDEQIKSVWLFCGRETEQYCQTVERSIWATKHPQQYNSGVGVLTPSSNCLDSVLGTILPCVVKNNDEINHSSNSAENKNTDSNKYTDRFTYYDHSDIKQLINSTIDTKCLFNTQWSQKRLGIDHPLLRKQPPKGLEKQKYQKITEKDAVVFVYSNWLPTNRNKLHSLAKHLKK
jgi:hypothetical protein